MGLVGGRAGAPRVGHAVLPLKPSGAPFRRFLGELKTRPLFGGTGDCGRTPAREEGPVRCRGTGGRTVPPCWDLPALLSGPGL